MAKYARKYVNRCQHLRIEDLMNAGQMGLLTAANKFDPNAGTKFTTYSSWWIRHEVSRTVHDEEMTIRVPVGVQEAATRQYMGKDVPEYKQPAIEAYTKLRRLPSLDAPLGSDGDGGTLGDFQASTDARADEQIEAADRVSMVQKVIASLTLRPIEKSILERRLMGDATLDDIGQTYGYSRERIRQLETGLKQKLAKALRPQLDDEPKLPARPSVVAPSVVTPAVSERAARVADTKVRRHGAGNYANPDIIRLAQLLREKGWSLRAIVKEVGLSKETVHTHTKQIRRSDAAVLMHKRWKAEGRPMLPPWRRTSR